MCGESAILQAMIKAVISDADGTLVNTMYFIRHGQYEAVVEYLVSKGVARTDLPSYEQYQTYLHQVVGGPTSSTLQQTIKLLARDFRSIDGIVVDGNEIDQRILRPIQDRLAPLYIHPFPDLDDFLRALEKLELRFGICTSGSGYMVVRNFGVSIPALGYVDLYKDQNSTDAQKLQAFSERMKVIYNLPDFSVVTADDVTAHKPDPEGLLCLMDRLGVTPEETVVLGDHPFDMQAAKSAGAHALGITHGFGAPEDLRVAGADALCANLYEVIYQLQYVFD